MRPLLALLLVPALAACSPVLPDSIAAVSCETVLLSPGAPSGADVSWTVEGYPLLLLTPSGDRGEVRFEAPAVARNETFRLHVSYPRGGSTVEQSVVVTVGPRAPFAGIPPGMAPGCAPFAHGVSSGDPRTDRVLLWTRITPTGEGPITLRYEVATDPQMRDVVTGDEVVTGPERDFTAVVEATGLSAGTTYYYRFLTDAGISSPLGRTRTAPEGSTDHLRFATVSCSSIYSGWFNAYRRLAERPDLDLVIHVGDYLYDFVDEDEQVRVPAGGEIRPDDLASWRRLNAYYLGDPDLRLARAMHPFFLMWDNHDVAWREPESAYEGSVQAFREWNPLMAPRDDDAPEINYRRITYGDLVDLTLLDILLHRDETTEPGTEERSILGETQFAWLAQQLADGDATWRILGSQKLLGTVAINPSLTGDEVFDRNTWDGFPASRTRLFTLLADAGLTDVVAVTGDAHISLALDLVDDPTDPPYDPSQPGRSVGVEFMAPSLSRGNFDEALPGGPVVYDGLRDDTLSRNPHHAYLELTSHGYGLLDIQPDRIVGEYWYSEILEASDEERFGASLTLNRGDGRWTRTPGTGPTPPRSLP